MTTTADDLPSADFAICGAGPVGAACALFLVERGIAADRIALLDARTRDAAKADDRMLAISHGSVVLLTRLGAWRDGSAPRASAIETIHVSHRGRFGRTLIDRRDYGVPALGYVVRHGDLTDALDTALARARIVVRRPCRVTTVEPDNAGLRLRVDDGGDRTNTAPVATSLTARHVVHAEGGLFDGQVRRAIHRDYGQAAVTAFVTGHDPSGSRTAFERFTDDGPIALLPAIETRAEGRVVHGYSLVWCGKPDDARARMALADDAFLDALHGAFGDRLGRFATAGPRRAYPLGLNAVDVVARARSSTAAEFAIGNAAQALHPVAGQGLNLGLRDAHELARLLAEADRRPPTRTEGADGGAQELVRRYRAMRRIDRAATVDVTDLMPRVFASTLVPVVAARGLTLALLDVARPLRAAFARQMMDGQRS